jgi:hypothetical protein
MSMRRLAGLLVLVLLPVAGAGCQVVDALAEFLPNRKPKPEPHDTALPVLLPAPSAYCGRLACLPDHPVHAVCLAGCRYVALARGRVKGSSYSLRLGDLWSSGAGGKPKAKEENLSTSRAMFRLTEDLVLETEKAYWETYRGWWALACQGALVDLAFAEEQLTQRLYDEKQATRADLEQARHNRLQAQADLAMALRGEENRQGLLEAEQQLHDAMGLPADCTLLLPIDCPLVDSPLPCCDELMKKVRLYRIDVQEGLAAVQLARRRCQREEEDENKKIEAQKAVEVAQAALDDACEHVRLELAGTIQRVLRARQLLGLNRQRRLAAALLVQSREEAVKQKGETRLNVIKAQRTLVEAIREEYRAAAECALAFLELEHQTGILVERSGLTMPTPPKLNTPRALSPAPPPPVVLPPTLPAAEPLLFRTEGLLAYKGLCLIDWVAGLARVHPGLPGRIASPSNQAGPELLPVLPKPD